MAKRIFVSFAIEDETKKIYSQDKQKTQKFPMSL